MKYYRVYAKISGRDETICCGTFHSKKLAIEEYKNLTKNKNLKEGVELKDNECLEITLTEEIYTLTQKQVVAKGKLI